MKGPGLRGSPITTAISEPVAGLRVHFNWSGVTLIACARASEMVARPAITIESSAAVFIGAFLPPGRCEPACNVSLFLFALVCQGGPKDFAGTLAASRCETAPGACGAGRAAIARDPW